MHDRSRRMPATASRAIVTSAWVRFCCGRSRILLMKRCWSRGDGRASAVVHVHRDLLAPNRGDVAQTEPRDRSGASLPTLDPLSIVRTHHWRRSDSLIDAPRFLRSFRISRVSCSREDWACRNELMASAVEARL